MSTSQTSITSVIHEYEILYTSRLIQKSKNWNDGKLKFYEFNKKIELHNEDGNLIATDFYKAKTIENILDKLLCEDNEFKLPNANFLVQVQGKIRAFEREVNLRAKSDDSQGSQKSASLGVKRSLVQESSSVLKIKKEKPMPNVSPYARRVASTRSFVIRDVPPPQKEQQPVKRPIHVTPQVTKVLNNNASRDKLKLENGPTVVPSVDLNLFKPQPQSKPEVAKVTQKRSTKESISSDSIIPNKVTNKEELSTNREPNMNILLQSADCRIAKRSSIRIPPKTSTHYQFMYAPSDGILNIGNKNSREASYEPMDVDISDVEEPDVSNEGDIGDIVEELKEKEQSNTQEKEPKEKVQTPQNEDQDEDDRIVDDNDDEIDDIDEIDEIQNLVDLQYQADIQDLEEDREYNPLESSDELSDSIEPSQMKAVERKSGVGFNKTSESSDSENEISDFPGTLETNPIQGRTLRIIDKTVAEEDEEEDADKDYDVSELEQDRKFKMMLEKMRKDEEALNDITNKRSKSKKKYNEAAEFNLSTDSEMEEI